MSADVPARFGVLGAGSWGTAIAAHLAGSGHRTLLWARSEEVVSAVNAGVNDAYLPEVELPVAARGGQGMLRATVDMDELAGLEEIFVVVPSHGFRSVARDLLRRRRDDRPVILISGTKGIEEESLARMSEVVAEESAAAGRRAEYAILSGPTFASELARGVPTACVLAAESPETARRLQRELSGAVLRLYTSGDVVGVEIGGAVKNVVAIAAGCVAGLDLGHNTLAALITRGLHEITRLGLACGGEPRTFSGLAGLGDLVLTCTGGESRNRRTGEYLARGWSLERIADHLKMVAEGVKNARSVRRLAERRGVEMPIAERMAEVLYAGKPPRQAVQELMTRDLKDEAAL